MKHNHPDKIIFLDIDGVLNLTPERFLLFNKQAMKYLEDIIEATGAKIVVSSSWRRENHESMTQDFITHGCTQKILDAIIGITVRGYSYVKKGSDLPIVRGNEIKQWIDTHLKYPWHHDPKLDEQYKIYGEDGSFKMMSTNYLGKDYSYVILDDDIDMLYDQRNNFINTNADTGITQAHVKEAIRILNYK